LSYIDAGNALKKIKNKKGEPWVKLLLTNPSPPPKKKKKKNPVCKIYPRNY
jgi:hypothetical protein